MAVNGRPGFLPWISCWRLWHWTMAMTTGTKPVTSNEEFIGAMGGTDENVSTGYCSDVKWKEEDLLIEINDGNITIPQTPAAASTPIHASTKSKIFHPQSHQGVRNLALECQLLHAS